MFEASFLLNLWFTNSMWKAYHPKGQTNEAAVSIVNTGSYHGNYNELKYLHKEGRWAYF